MSRSIKHPVTSDRMAFSRGPAVRVVRVCESAFTLIELLTVVAIIGVLAAILIPVVGRVRDSARSSHCMSNLLTGRTFLDHPE